MATNVKNKAVANDYLNRMLQDKGFREDLTTIVNRQESDTKDDFFLQLIIMDISGKTGYLFEEEEFKTEIRNRLGLEKRESEPEN